MAEYTITDTNLHIEDSAFVSKKCFRGDLEWIHDDCPTSSVFKRSYCSLELEWASHNFLYMLDMFKNHTKDVDLNYPQKWYEVIGYAILGSISWIFIK